MQWNYQFRSETLAELLQLWTYILQTRCVTAVGNCRHIPLELKPIIYQTIRFAGYIDKIILLHISERRHVRTLQEHILAWLCDHFDLLKRDWRSIKYPCINKILNSDYSGVLYPSTQQILFFFSKSHLRAGWTK